MQNCNHVLLVLVLFVPQLSFGQLLYEFIEVDSKDVLATLELSSLPATHEQFVDLTFSDSGNDVFGLGDSFPSTFTEMAREGRIRDDGEMGLDGVDSEAGLFALMIGIVPLELSPRPEATSDITFTVIGSQLTERDRLRLSYFRAEPGGPLNPNSITRYGTWQRLVPEPAASWLWLPLCVLIFRKITLGVEHAHLNSVLHRDLKPDNVLLDDDETAVVSDFGLLRDFNSVSTELTLSGQAMGTLMFMAPEQYLDTKAVDERADIYSLGRMIIRCCGGLMSQESQYLKDLPPLLRPIVARCTEFDVAARYQTISELRSAIEESYPSVVPPPP